VISTTTENRGERHARNPLRKCRDKTPYRKEYSLGAGENSSAKKVYEKKQQLIKKLRDWEKRNCNARPGKKSIDAGNPPASRGEF